MCVDREFADGRALNVPQVVCDHVPEFLREVVNFCV